MSYISEEYNRAKALDEANGEVGFYAAAAAASTAAATVASLACSKRKRELTSSP
jgi:hypothetical protein